MMLQFTKHAGRHVADIRVYALSTCPYCHATLDFLDENSIEYEYVYVDKLRGADLEEAEKEIKKYNPDETFPTIVINGGEQIIIGFQEEKLAELIAE